MTCKLQKQTAFSRVVSEHSVKDSCLQN